MKSDNLKLSGVNADNAATTITDVDIRTGMQVAALKQAVVDHLHYSIGRLPSVATPYDYHRFSHFACGKG